MSEKITGFVGVFQHKLEKLRKKLKNSDLTDEQLKNLRREIKQLENTLEGLTEEKAKIKCPECGHHFKVDVEKIKV